MGTSGSSEQLAVPGTSPCGHHIHGPMGYLGTVGNDCTIPTEQRVSLQPQGCCRGEEKPLAWLQSTLSKGHPLLPQSVSLQTPASCTQDTVSPPRDFFLLLL